MFRIVAATMAIFSSLVAKAETSVNTKSACLEAAQSKYKEETGLAALYMNQGMRACYDIIDLGHPVPGSVCIKRVESNYARDVANAQAGLNQATNACENSAE